jgi:hypothetical protein
MHNKKSNKKWVPKNPNTPNQQQNTWSGQPGMWMPQPQMMWPQVQPQMIWPQVQGQPQMMWPQPQMVWVPQQAQPQMMWPQPQMMWTFQGQNNIRPQTTMSNQESVEKDIDTLSNSVKDLSVSPSTPIIEDVSEPSEPSESSEPLPQLVPRTTRSTGRSNEPAREVKKPVRPPVNSSKQSLEQSTSEQIVELTTSRKPSEQTETQSLDLTGYTGHSWVRVSSNKQLKNCSSTIQRDLINKFCSNTKLILCDKPATESKPGYTSCTNLGTSGWNLDKDSPEYTTHYEPLTHIPKLCLVALYVSRFCRSYSIGRAFEEAVRKNGGRLVFLFDGTESDDAVLSSETPVRAAIDTSIPEQREKFLELLRSAEQQMNEHSNRMKQVWAERKRSRGDATAEPQAKRRATIQNTSQNALRKMITESEPNSSLIRLRRWVTAAHVGTGYKNHKTIVDEFRALVDWTEHPEWIDKYYANPITISSSKLDLATIVDLLGAPPNGYAIKLPPGIDNTRVYWTEELLRVLIE